MSQICTLPTLRLVKCNHLEIATRQPNLISTMVAILNLSFFLNVLIMALYCSAIINCLFGQTRPTRERSLLKFFFSSKTNEFLFSSWYL